MSTTKTKSKKSTVKTKKGIHSYADITPEWRKKCEDALANIEAGKYPPSLIYEVHNYLMGLKEEVSACGSCLKRRGNNIRAEYLSLKKDYENVVEIVSTPTTTQDNIVVIKNELEEKHDEFVANMTEDEHEEEREEERMIDEYAEKYNRYGYIPLTANSLTNKFIRKHKAEIIERAKRLEYV